MNVEVLTNWQNEAFLAPLFFRHYEWADKITIVLEPSTNDGTREEISRFQNRALTPGYWPEIVVIEHAECDGKIDDIQKAIFDAQVINQSTADWLIRVDSDEFVFPAPYGRSPRKALEEVPSDKLAIICAEYQVFRHATDRDVDRTQPPVPQRIHGDPDRHVSQYNRGFVKPAIMRPSAKPQVSIGCHFIVGFNYDPATGRSDEQNVHGGGDVIEKGVTDPRVHTELWTGAHWCRADPCFAITRRVDNRHLRLGGWNKSLDEQFRGGVAPDRDRMIAELTAELTAHENDPIVIPL